MWAQISEIARMTEHLMGKDARELVNGGSEGVVQNGGKLDGERNKVGLKNEFMCNGRR